MILIDASNVNSGGGITLLSYLAATLDRKEINYFVITDQRGINNSIDILKQAKVSINVFNRKEILNKFIQQKKPKVILFFGNYPPPVKYDKIRTFTYIQNRFVLSWSNTKYKSLHKRLYAIAAMIYIKLHLKNSDYYIFQNSLARDEFQRTYKANFINNTFILPFYNNTNHLSINSEFVNRKNDFIYASADMPHKNHINLFKAWEINFRLGFNNSLYITIDDQSNTKVTKYYRKLKKEGVPIINLGFVSHDEIISRTKELKYAVFPSLIETIGLFLVESTLLGCKVLAPDSDYVKEVIKPSDYFDPNDPNDMALKIRYILENDVSFPELVIKNKIDNFTKLLTS